MSHRRQRACALTGDEGRLRQILLNLVGNAIKFTEMGKITVSASVESRTEASVLLHFAVSDTGVGIPAEKLRLIFDPFRQADSSTTRKYGGTGLGLTICARLAEQMGGRIWVNSEPGSGSTFHFTARLGLWREVPPPSAAPVADVKPAAATMRRLHVLLAEDNAVNRKIAVRFLEKMGHAVTVACDGREAVDALAREQFDLALVDIQMPELDGFEVAAAVRAREAGTERRLPLLAVTAHAMQGDRERAALPPAWTATFPSRSSSTCWPKPSQRCFRPRRIVL